MAGALHARGGGGAHPRQNPALAHPAAAWPRPSIVSLRYISSSQQKPLSLSSVNLLTNRRSIAGTRSGGIAETQEMIDFCAEHGVQAQVEVIGADGIDEAYKRVLTRDVRFRFVIDVSTMRDTKAAPPIAELKASLA